MPAESVDVEKSLQSLMEQHLEASLGVRFLATEYITGKELQGVFVDDNDSYRLVQDYTFDSPSMATAVMLARSANGRTEWKNDQDRTLKQIQEEGPLLQI